MRWLPTPIDGRVAHDLSDDDLRALRDALHALQTGQGGAIPRATLARLAGKGHHLTIDMAAADTLGAPLVVVRAARAPDSCFDALTPRQREVAALVATGLRNKDIALALGIRLATVKDHVHAILSKTGLDSRAAVVAAWGGQAPGGPS